MSRVSCLADCSASRRAIRYGVYNTRLKLAPKICNLCMVIADTETHVHNAYTIATRYCLSTLLTQLKRYDRGNTKPKKKSLERSCHLSQCVNGGVGTGVYLQKLLYAILCLLYSYVHTIDPEIHEIFFSPSQPFSIARSFLLRRV